MILVNKIFLNLKKESEQKTLNLLTLKHRLKEYGKVKKIKSVNTQEVSQTKNNKIMLSSKCAQYAMAKC